MKNFVYILSIAIFYTLQFQLGNGANIVFFFALSSYSHRIAVWPLVHKLADMGHNITFFHPYVPKHTHPKVKEMFPPKVQKLMDLSNTLDNLLTTRLQKRRTGTQREVLALPGISLVLCDAYLSSPETIEWMKTAKVDLVIMDGLFNECGFGIAHKFGAKVAFFATSTIFSFWHDELGFPAETSWIPEMHVSFPSPLSFIERTITTLLTVAIHAGRTLIYFPELENIMRYQLDIPNMPPITDMMKNISMILMNSHFSEEFARSLPPLIIPVGGMHLDIQGKKKSEIPKEIKSFINGTGENGFIYISFGSAANIASAPEELRNIFYTALSNSKSRFVWKWNGPRPKEMPPNVITAEWLPQQELLAHPKIKAFISHGGLLSTFEAIASGVPMIVFPLFAEQDYNSFRIEKMGRGIRLEIDSLTLSIFQNAISEILKNSSYKNTMKKTAQIFNDRPAKPLDTAVWWTEYVLRHDNTLHLMPLAVNQTWYQRRLLDVWLMVSFVLISIVLITLFVVKKILAFLFSLIFTKDVKTNKYKSPNQKNGPKVKKS